VTPATSANNDMVQGWQIGHFLANFKKSGHFLTTLGMKNVFGHFVKFGHFWPVFGLSL